MHQAQDDKPTRASPLLAASDQSLVAAIVIGGLALRIPRAMESLWYDEIAAWRDYGSKGPAAIITTYYDPANHIAHTLLTWCSFKLFEPASSVELGLRIPALLFSLASIIVIYGLVRRVLNDRALALVAGLIMAIMPVAVLEGAESRGYSMMIFFSAASTWALLAVTSHNEHARTFRGGWIMYAILIALGIWSHMTTVFVPIGHAAWVVGRSWRERDRQLLLRGAGGLTLAAVFTIALYLPVFDDLMRIRATFSAEEGDEPTIFSAEGLHLMYQLGGSWYWWAALPGLLLFAIGGWRAMRDRRLRTLILALLSGLPIMVIAIVLADSWMYARFALFALPGTAVLIAAGITFLGRRNRWIGTAAAIVFIATCASDLVVRPPKQPLREAGAFVSQSMAPQERVLVIGLRHEVMNAYIGLMRPVFSLQLGIDLETKLEASRPQWIIMLYPEKIAPERKVLLDEHGYMIVAHFDGWLDWGDGDVVVWKRGSGESGAGSR